MENKKGQYGILISGIFVIIIAIIIILSIKQKNKDMAELDNIVHDCESKEYIINICDKMGYNINMCLDYAKKRDIVCNDNKNLKTLDNKNA